MPRRWSGIFGSGRCGSSTTRAGPSRCGRKSGATRSVWCGRRASRSTSSGARISARRSGSSRSSPSAGILDHTPMGPHENASDDHLTTRRPRRRDPPTVWVQPHPDPHPVPRIRKSWGGLPEGAWATLAGSRFDPRPEPAQEEGGLLPGCRRGVNAEPRLHPSIPRRDSRRGRKTLGAPVTSR